MPDNIDCPHLQQLEHTLQHCQSQSEVLRATHDNYLSIIDELKQDLDELTVQVEQQREACDTESELESQYSEQAAQLEATIILRPIEHPAFDHNEHLICQISNLKEALQERDNQITKLNSLLNSYTDMKETARLKDEICQLKQRGFEQAHKMREVATVLKTQEEKREAMCVKYKKLLCSFEEQRKEVERINRLSQRLQDRLCEVQNLHGEVCAERDLLREEIIALKDKDACMSGRERSLCDQLKCSQLEVDKSRKLIREMQAHILEADSQHRETVKQLECANEEIRQQVRDIGCDCKQMQVKLKQQADVNEQQELIISSFRKWKDAQIRSDEAMRQCIKRAEEHINMLLEENHRLCDSYRNMHRDYCILEVELQRVKACIAKADAPSTSLPRPRAGDNVEQPGETDMAKRLQYLSQTSRRVSDQIKALNDLEADLPTTSRRPATNKPTQH